MPNLKIRDAGKEFTRQIEGDSATLGRGDTNDIDIEDAKASKEHCRIERMGQRWKLIDLESKNGTKVNGEFRNKAWLGHGDLVQIGAAELRFGLEATARPGSAAAARKAPPDRGEEGEEGEEEEEAPRRRRRNNLPLILGVSVPVGVTILVLLINLAAGTSVNVTVKKRGERLVEQGQYDQAIHYVEQNGDWARKDHVILDRFLEEARENKVAYERITREQEGNRILSRVGILIRSYNQGHVESGPDQILPLMKRLREELSDTDSAAAAKANYPAWYAGRVPERASDVLSSGGRLRKDWDAAVAQSEQYRKELAFREARETVERFVTARDVVVLGAGDLATYEQLRDDELLKIDRLAESVYRGHEAEAGRLLKNKRYDEAIAKYREIVEKFGLDAYVRKAQGEISKIEQLKAGGK